jgi:hypothetical protein
MFVSLFYVNARTKEKLIKVIVKYLKVLPYLKSDGIVSPCGSFPFLVVVHRVCGTLHESSLMSHVFLVQIVKLHVSLSSSPMRVYLRTSQVDIESFPAGVSPTKYPISTIAYYRLKNQPRHHV